MKKTLTVLINLLFASQVLYNQTPKTPGTPIAEIFTNFHLGLNDTSETTGFGLTRAYFGYKFLPGNNFSGTIILNIGNPDELAPGSEPRRYAYFREASISWSCEKLQAAIGITGTRLFSFQQKFWGKRYIANTYQSLNGYGFVADLGMAVDYVFSDVLKADITIMNGEGYSNIQLDNGIRTSVGFTLTPGNHFAVRLYGDILKTSGLWQPMFVGFIGFKNDRVTAGGEVTYKSNIEPVRGHHAWGVSGTGSLGLTQKTEIFTRFDFSASVTPPGDITPWNRENDGNFFIAGFQYSPVENVKFAVDYQGTYPYAREKIASKAIFLNALFRF
jgi:hypothetical protein